MSSTLPVMRNSRSTRVDSGPRGIDVDATVRWRPQRRRQRRRPIPRPPPFLAAAAAAPSDDGLFSIPLGAQCGVRVPRLILGTMQFGEALGPEEAHRIMSAAAEEGAAAAAASAAAAGDSKPPFLALDTAEAYPVPMARPTSGDSERIIGDWLRAPVGQSGGGGGGGGSRRERTVLITKVSGPGGQPWIRGGPPRLDGAHLARALEGSLARLRVDEIDLLMLHWPDRYVPMFGEVEFDPTRSFFPAVSSSGNGGDDDDDDDGFAEAERHFEDVLGAAFDAISAGKLRAVGLSNETPTGLLAASSASRRRRRRERRREEEEEEGGGGGGGGGGGAGREGRGPRRLRRRDKLALFPGIAAVSNAYSLLARNFDSNGMAEACEATRVPLLGYGPLAAGLLSGKYEAGAGGDGGGGDGGGGGPSAGGGGPPLARLNRYRHEYAEEGRRYARTPRVREAVRDYVEIARRHGLRGGGAELALRFALSAPSGGGVGIKRAAVFGATSVGNVRSAFAAAAEGPLSEEIIAECDAVHARNPNPAP